MNIGRAVRICRSARGWTQQDLAGKSEVGKSMLSLVEAGKRELSIDAIKRVCAALDIPMHLFMVLAATPEQVDAMTPASCVPVLTWLQEAR
jgi:transcriptional regulator with XRE-family HTH domain